MSPRTQVSFAPLALGLAISSALSWFAFSTVGPGLESATASASDASAASGTVAGPLAAAADDFVDSIGVNTHLQYLDTNYGNFDGVVLPRLAELGVRHIRDAAYTGPESGPDSEYYRRMRVLSEMGIKLDLTTSLATRWGPATDYSRLAKVQDWTGGAVESFEGVNEPDQSGLADWVSETRKAQASLTSAVQETAGFDNVDVVLPSVTSPEGADHLGDMSATGDTGNLHNYISDRNPETAGWGDDGYGSLAWNLRRVSDVLAPTLPTVSTETGYFTSPLTGNGISREAAGTYIPRLLMNQFHAGVQRTYLYELLDERNDPRDSESNYGLVGSEGTPKPAFRAVAAMIDLLSDPGPSFDPGRLDYRLSGDTADVHQLLLQKRDGTFYLALWSSKPVWDSDGDRDVAVPDQAVTVSLPSGFAVGSLSALGPAGAMTTRSLDAASLKLDVGPAISFLRVNGSTPVTSPVADITTPATAPTVPVTTDPSGMNRGNVVVSRTDPAGDLVRHGPARPRRISQAADIRSVRLTRGADALRVDILVRHLPRSDLGNDAAVTYEVTGLGSTRASPFLLSVSSRRTPFHDRATRRRGTCPAAASSYDTRANRITISVPSQCLPDDVALKLQVRATAVTGTQRSGITRWTDNLRSPPIPQ